MARRCFADDKKRRGHILFRKHIEHRLGVAAVWAVVECQRNDALPRRNTVERRPKEIAARILHRLVRQKTGGSRDACNAGSEGYPARIFSRALASVARNPGALKPEKSSTTF